MSLVEKRKKLLREKRNYRIKVFILIVIIISTIVSLYFSIDIKGVKYKKGKAYGDWSTFKDKKKVK